jgi:hypothetical protein
MNLKQTYHQLCDIGERAGKIADALQHERDHDWHRVFMAARELSLVIQHSMTSLSEKTREVIAKN